MNNTSRDILNIHSSSLRTENSLIQLQAQLQKMNEKQEEIAAKVDLCFKKLESLETKDGNILIFDVNTSVNTFFLFLAPANSNFGQQLNLLNPTGISNVPIYRPQILGSSENKLKQKLNYFIQQWQGDSVVLDANDGNEFRKEKEHRLNMYESNLRILGKIAVDKLIKKVEARHKDWRGVSCSNVDPDLKQESLTFLRTLAITNNIPTSRCVEFWLEKALISYLYHNRSRRLRAKQPGPEQSQSQSVANTQSETRLSLQPLLQLSPIVPIASCLTTPPLQMSSPSQPTHLSPSLASLPPTSLPPSSINSPMSSPSLSHSVQHASQIHSPLSEMQSTSLTENLLLKVQELEQRLLQQQLLSQSSQLPPPSSSLSSHRNRNTHKKSTFAFLALDIVNRHAPLSVCHLFNIVFRCRLKSCKLITDLMLSWNKSLDYPDKRLAESRMSVVGFVITPQANLKSIIVCFCDETKSN
ncbi:hypothetical protein EDC96DRAFT_545276 [Choanephora cucurbitarum]|nr:hypothetical protein EDC96DRAFT_545276 [Choanephora cucurbitarum]